MVKPVTTTPRSMRISRNAGSFRGSLSAWHPPYTHSLEQQANERKLSQSRAEDLLSNDWAANSGINAIATNAVGTGLRPQSKINAKRLGISKDQALELQSESEAIWREWTSCAHVRGILHFEDLQFLGLRTMLGKGEMLHLPVNLAVPGRRIQLAIQDVQVSRLRTPVDKVYDPRIVDGVQLGQYGQPEFYWLATPSATLSRTMDFSSLGSDQFVRIPAHIGHRPGCFHLFRPTEEEQVRGESVLQSGINLFRHLSDSLDNELLAQVVTASMAMFIAKEQGVGLPDYVDTDAEDSSPQHYEEVLPGTVMYGEVNEKPYVLESSRPSPNFATFSEFVLRAMAASIDMPYEVLAKDFSKTNYSSARAALLEAWRVYLLYRSWLTRHYCQPIWAMVIEEAWLTGRLSLPTGAPDFYDDIYGYTQALWIGPARGYVDPVKEITATSLALENKLMTYSEALSERGRDVEEVWEERMEEEALLAKFSIHPVKTSTASTTKQKESQYGSV